MRPDPIASASTAPIWPHSATGKIALAHMKEFPDYYVRLRRMEREAKAEREAERDA